MEGYEGSNYEDEQTQCILLRMYSFVNDSSEYVHTCKGRKEGSERVQPFVYGQRVRRRVCVMAKAGRTVCVGQKSAGQKASGQNATGQNGVEHNSNQ